MKLDLSKIDLSLAPGIYIGDKFVPYTDLPYRDLVVAAKNDVVISPMSIGKGTGLDGKDVSIFCATCNKKHKYEEKVYGVYADQLYGVFEVRLNILRWQAEDITYNAHKMRYIRWHDLRFPDSEIFPKYTIKAERGGIVEFLI